MVRSDFREHLPGELLRSLEILPVWMSPVREEEFSPAVERAEHRRTLLSHRVREVREHLLGTFRPTRRCEEGDLRFREVRGLDEPGECFSRLSAIDSAAEESTPVPAGTGLWMSPTLVPSSLAMASATFFVFPPLESTSTAIPGIITPVSGIVYKQVSFPRGTAMFPLVPAPLWHRSEEIAPLHAAGGNTAPIGFADGISHLLSGEPNR